MGLIEIMGLHPDDTAGETFATLAAELCSGLERYWKTAGKILDNSGISLQPPPPDYLAMEKNIFSTLFLYSYYAAGIDPARREVYVAVNQCLRGMVTGCDNILDDEYKVVVTIQKSVWRTVSPPPETGKLYDIKRFEKWFLSVCTIRASCAPLGIPVMPNK